MINAAELNEIDLEMVTGGTVTKNKYTEEQYNSMGIQTSYHLILKDKFTLPNGQTTSERGANFYMSYFYDGDNPCNRSEEYVYNFIEKLYPYSVI